MSVRSALSVVAALLAIGPSATAIALCRADEIVARELGCPASNAECVIAGQHTIERECVLDFGARRVTVLTTGRLNVGSGSMQLRAGHLTLHGTINGVGSATGARGGLIRIDISGDLRVSRSGSQFGLIDVSGNSSAGEIIVRAGGAVSIEGQLRARNLNQRSTGGLIDITAGQNLVSTAASVISAAGGNDSDGGGEIDLTAGGNLVVGNTLIADGTDGGFVSLRADGTITVQGISATGVGDAGTGGCVDVAAGAGAVVQGALTAQGTTGGCGGLVCLDGGFGAVTIASTAVINANGARPDGGGGQVTILSRGSAAVNGRVQALGPTGETCGGTVCVEAGLDIVLGSNGQVNVSGGDSGGEVELAAGRDLRVDYYTGSGNVSLDASGRQAGSLGGDATLRAGQGGSGSLSLNGVVDVRSNAPCSAQSGCGEAGLTELMGCNVDLGQLGQLRAGGPNAGQNSLIARAQLTVRGAVDAQPTRSGGAVGSNRFLHRAGLSPVVIGNRVSPAARSLTLTTCPMLGDTEPPCLNPCPVCGNGLIEFPETCDLGQQPPRSCGGCSIFCALENCDDGLVCTGDSCNPDVGCLNRPTPLCHEPTPTITGTRPTATITPTPSVTPTPTHTPSASPSPVITPTRTASASATATLTSTPTPPLSTPTATATVSAEPTIPAGCPGDCNDDGHVVVNELVVGVNIALGNTSASACPAFDRNGDGAVTINELIAGVNAALIGC